jgi:hypothetical protein
MRATSMSVAGRLMLGAAISKSSASPRRTLHFIVQVRPLRAPLIPHDFFTLGL